MASGRRPPDEGTQDAPEEEWPCCLTPCRVPCACCCTFVLPGVRHSFAPVSGYVNWLRGDYFARHLLGRAADSVDIVELNREVEQVGDKRRR